MAYSDRTASSACAPLVSRRTGLILCIGILLVGFAVRLYRFPAVPIGLHQDEISEAYEAYSLLHTGADRWGYHLPVYFLSWGSGQNVLQAYLTIPVVAVIGLTRTSARLIPLLCGLLGLPLMFATVRRWHGEVAALAALTFLALCPWHIMISRWGIENVPVPCFLLLGLYTFGKALDARSGGGAAVTILPCLLPFALTMYAYGVTVVVVPPFLLLLFVLGLSSIRRRVKMWLGALAVFGIASLPIAFYVLKNYITKTNYAFEHWLPFSVPLLPWNRLAEVSIENKSHTIIGHNLSFLLHTMQDGTSWFQVPHIRPLPLIVLGLSLLSICYELRRIIQTRRFQEPFVLWLIACIPLLFTVPLNISRGIALFAPVVALAGSGFGLVLGSLRTRARRIAWVAVSVLLFLFTTEQFLHAYFGTTYAAEVRPTLYPDLPRAFQAVQALAGPTTPIYVSDQLALNHMQALWFMKVDPKIFQNSGATYIHPDFGRYLFSRNSLVGKSGPYVFLLKDNEPPTCAAPSRMQQVGDFTVGECP